MRRFYVKYNFFVLLSVSLLLLACVESDALERGGSVEFSPTDLSVTASDGFDRVILSGCDLSGYVGCPQLPVRSVFIAIPRSAQVEGVEVTPVETEEIPGRHLVFPAQAPQILPMVGVPATPVEFVEPDPSVYARASAWPPELFEMGKVGNLLGYRVVGLTLHPVQYIPSERRLLIHKRLDVKVKYKTGSISLGTPLLTSTSSQGLCRGLVEGLLLNDEDLMLETPVFENITTVLPPNDYEYVIVSAAQYDTVFQRLADWKTRKGVPANVVTTEWIYSNYTGWDNAEKVRNFIKDAHANWGTMWVLLGGDVNVVPDRVAFAMECQAGFYADEDSIRADLYYSDLDGTWDLNGNHIYGEVADSVDLYADVFVGRAAAENLAEIQTFVDKALTYERNPVADYQTDMGFFAEVLWNTPYTDAAVFKDMIDDASIPPVFNITKLYERDGNENKPSVIAAINQGQNFINHAGHCSYSVMSVGAGALTGADMDTLSNGNRIGFMYSIGCWPAAFDYDCVAEHFVNCAGGGGVAFIGNSRYGWGSPGNPGYGFSDKFDIELFNELFGNEVTRAGATVAATKAFFAPRSCVENVYRWHQYQVNLLGEPEMSIWTDSLRTFAVHHPDSVPAEAAGFAVTVEDGGMQVPAALVCLMKDDEVYERILTDEAGQAFFTISPTSPGELHVTVTAQNYIPYEGVANVFTLGPFVKWYRSGIADPDGNNDGVCNPGEKIWLTVFVKNYGTQVANSVDGLISTSDPFVTLEQTAATFGDLLAGDTASCSPELEFTVSSACTNGHVAYLDLNTNDGAGHTWSDVIGVKVCTPSISFFGYNVVDTIGNNNGVPEPGETVALLAYLRNGGWGAARGVTALLSSGDPYLSISDSSAAVGDIEAGKDGWARFELTVDGACPAVWFPWLKIHVTTSESQSYEDSLIFVIGSPGLGDDVESGVGDWTYEGLWHITDHRSHSSSHSWYCGHEGAWQYDDQMDASLTGPGFVVGPSAYLSFWHWYDMPIYGSDGLYIEIDCGSGWELLDFKGCGGALDSLLPGRMWFSEWYDLSSYPVGDSARVRFRFHSDASDVGEGWYIDDINVGAECTGVDEGFRKRVGPGPARLYANRPNPFVSVTTIYAFSPWDSQVSLEIFDIAGRFVARLPMINNGSGQLATTWDGSASDGRACPAGTYFFRLNPQLGTVSKKMILLR
jgi:hypothetical protein